MMITGLMKKRVSMGVAATTIMLVVAGGVGFLVIGTGDNAAQAHEDGTNHFHPTPTPAPTITPTPLPPLGLKAQIFLSPVAYYHDESRTLEIITTVKGAPSPEEWQWSSSNQFVLIQTQRWSFAGHCGPGHINEPRHEDGVIVCTMRLPDYIDFNNQQEPLVAQISTGATYWARGDRSEHLGLTSTFYIDLHHESSRKE